MGVRSLRNVVGERVVGSEFVWFWGDPSVLVGFEMWLGFALKWSQVFMGCNSVDTSKFELRTEQKSRVLASFGHVVVNIIDRMTTRDHDPCVLPIFPHNLLLDNVISEYPLSAF